VTGRRQSALDELKAKYPKLHTVQSDVADPAQIAFLAKRVKAGYPKLDVLMNNAGIMLHKNLKAPAADLDGLMTEVNINVGGVIRMTSAFIDILTPNKGTVINVSSALAFVPLPSGPIYCATIQSCLLMKLGASRRICALISTAGIQQRKFLHTGRPIMISGANIERVDSPWGRDVPSNNGFSTHRSRSPT
jgi:NADP-dependent 3-hydroxy acid dehydrogenase YdfG